MRKQPIDETRLLEAQSDREYQTRIDAERCTLEFATASRRRLDSGKEPITDGALFGGPAQFTLFEEVV